MGVPALIIGGISAVGSIVAGVAGANAADKAGKRAAAAAAKGYYTPDEAAYQDPYAEARRGRLDEQFASASEGVSSDFRDRQLGLYDDLGNRKSVVELQTERNQQAAIGAAQAQPGAAGGLGLRNLLGAQQNIAAGSNIARLQEQQQNDNLRANIAAGGRGADLGEYGAQQGAVLNILQQQAQEDEAQRAARIKREELIELNKRGVSTGVSNAETARGKAQGAAYGGIASGLGGIAGTAFGAYAANTTGTPTTGVKTKP